MNKTLVIFLHFLRTATSAQKNNFIKNCLELARTQKELTEQKCTIAVHSYYGGPELKTCGPKKVSFIFVNAGGKNLEKEAKVIDTVFSNMKKLGDIVLEEYKIYEEEETEP